MAKKRSKRPPYLFFIIIAFVLWYYFSQLKENKKFGGDLPVPVSGNEHIIWGFPIEENAEVHIYEGLVSGYDPEKKNPDWVSYHLIPEYFTGRKLLDKRKFKPDPSFKEENKVVTSDYTRSGFDRGHMAPQADMKGRDILCEKQACYLTNIAPQKPNFNRKTWLNLENAVRKWTKSYGESWVISGPWYDDEEYLIKEKIEIPDGFYKIIVLKNSDAYSPLAFVLDQDDVSRDLESYQVTIDSIENLTGIDFFHELADSIENDFESSLLPLPMGWK